MKKNDFLTLIYKNKKKEMNTRKENVNNIKTNPNNPRIIRDDNYKKLLQSVIDFPEMMDVRPIVIDENNIVLGGNMRLKACREAGLKEVSVVQFNNLTEEQKKEFILKDNNSFGIWDTKMLAEWDSETLLKSGFEEWDLIDIFGENHMTPGLKKELEGSNFKDLIIDVNEYIKQNIIFFNEFMIEFEDDDIKEKIKNIKEGDNELFINELKDLIKKWG
jgi:hypothetical protein